MSLTIEIDATLVAARPPCRRAGTDRRTRLAEDGLRQRGLVGDAPRRDPVRDRLAQLRRAEYAGVGDVAHLVRVGVDVGADDLNVGRAGGDRRDGLVPGELEAMRDEVGEEFFVANFVPRDAVDEPGQDGFL